MFKQGNAERLLGIGGIIVLAIPACSSVARNFSSGASGAGGQGGGGNGGGGTLPGSAGGAGSSGGRPSTSTADGTGVSSSATAGESGASGAPALCVSECKAGLVQCGTTGVQTCTVQDDGCTAWVTTTECGPHQSCAEASGTAACQCNATVCTQNGAVCQDGQVLGSCTSDANGCVYVASTQTCTAPQKCGGIAPNAACSCPANTTLCGSACVNLASDASNCGACGRSCMSSAIAIGQCAASVCKPFTLQSLGPLTPPLLIDPITLPLASDATALYATLSATAAVSINPQSGAIVQSPANIYRPSNFGPSGIFAQNASTLYGLDNATGDARVVGITKSTMLPFTVSYSQPTGADLWLGLVPGSVDQICVLTNGDTMVLHCEGAGTASSSLSVCSNGPDSVCAGVNGFAADGLGVVWGPEGFQVDGAPNVGQNALIIGPSSLSPKTTLSLPPSTVPGPILVDAKNIYWFDSGVGHLFYKTARAASGATTMLSSSAIANVPAQLALDSTYLYWTDTTIGTVSRVPIAGTSATAPVVIATGQAGPTGIAVDANAVYWINGSGNALVKMRKP